MSSLSFTHLEGLEFDIEKRNCYALVRDFYRDNFGIELTPYSCPTNWWTSEMDLITRLSGDEGFTALHCHPRDYQAGDVFVMAIQASHGNHCAVLLPDGQILHHLVGQRSCVTTYGGMFRNTTVGVYRHKDVPVQKHETLVGIHEFLPPHIRRRLERRTEEQARPAGEQ